MTEKTFKIVNGDISDGYHTFDELYEHRCLLFLNWLKGAICNPFWVRDHYEGWDLVGCAIEGRGQISYHIPIKYRRAYEGYIEELTAEEYAYDGHTPQDVVRILEELLFA